MRYILSIDQGTTSSRAIIYDQDFKNVGMAQQTFQQHYPEPGWVEHDLWEIWSSVEAAIKGALNAAGKDADFSPSRIEAIGITNQRETFALWERRSGHSIGRAIVWQCRRSAEICERLKKSAAGKKIPAITGLVLDPYFSGTKLKWLLEQNSDAKKRSKTGELAFGTMDTFLVWKLTAGAKHATDVTNASRTLLMDLRSLKWSEHCLKTLGVPREILPEIIDSDGDFGKTKGLGFLPDGIPIRGVLGDQQAALFGQECFGVGDAKCTYGTGAFLLLNSGDKPKKTKSGLSTVAWRIKGKTTYALEGSVFIAGAAVQWLRDGLGLIQKSSEIQTLAGQVKDSDGVFFIPALSGLGSPYWAPEAKGLLGGVTRRSTKAHVGRAVLEGIAYSVGELFENLEKDSGIRIKKIKVDGGASVNPFLLQFQSDLMLTPIERPVDVESTARGAAYAAAFGAKMIDSEKKLLGKNPIEAQFKPKIKAAAAAELMRVWKRRVGALLKGCY